ncbi:Wall-associated receptor kinase 2 [Olea europaea subsp. europaea]|uniref:Wall-associated receptor kinase 2 n=1 Tax=Olea europaea subsp. europaea TaxID=158383 RepID=A0A8S0PQT5_OLEEU|nr:Wall-associated receptor kinase 2 [Olea europaea subsp. europaea]
MREGCYFNETFSVTCNKTHDDLPKLYWTNSTIQITNITLEGQMRVSQFIAKDCYSQNGTRVLYKDPWIKVPLGFTINNTANKFIVVGCDTYAYVSRYRENRNYETGCTSTCDNKDDLVDGSCSGLGCCQMSIPKHVWEVEVTLNSFNNFSYVWDFNNCSYGFLAEESTFNFSASEFSRLRNVEMLPLVIDWSVGDRTCAEARNNTSSYACKSVNSECYEPANGYGYRCYCQAGYQGNPYLYHGCKGCIRSDQSFVFKLVAGIATGVSALLLAGCCLCLELNRRKLVTMKRKFFLQNGGLSLQEQLIRKEKSADMAKLFTSVELKKATNNFHNSRIIGQGRFGIVYKGILSDNRIVAIKKSKQVDPNQVEQFINE